MKTTKILFLTANPVNSRHLMLDEEFRRIKERLHESSLNNHIELVDVQAARPDDWLQALNAQRFRMVHFSGHGTRGGALQHVGSDGAAQPVSFQALKATLRALKGEICLMVFNACHSRQQAEMIAEEIDCVVAINEAIPDDAAIVFSNAFYRALFSRKLVQNAFDQGQAAVMMEGELRDEHMPELLVRPGIDASKVTLIPPERPGKVFILSSQESRNDSRLLDELHKYLAYYVQERMLDYWDYTKLDPGSKRDQVTLQALASSSVAVLLLSVDFFASPSITQDQLPRILQAYKRGEITILCVLLSKCALEDTELKGFTPVNFQSLSKLNRSERADIWHDLVTFVRDNLRKDI